jgi:phage FluMu gp28-like protein
MCIDQTGMGLPVTERAQELHGKYRVEGVTMTNAVKETLAVNAKNIIEDRYAQIPDDEIVRESFHAIQKEVTVSGNVRFDADRTEEIGHADDFWAFALAEHANSGGSELPWAQSQPSNYPWYGAYAGNFRLIMEKY